jgi:NosR/NirI family nitrous oxide reductase transcriptional regulator
LFNSLRQSFRVPRSGLRLGLRLYRVGVVVAIAWLIHQQHTWFTARDNTRITLDQAKEFFPNVVRLDLRDADRGFHYALDADGTPAGVLLTTAPDTDDVIGYSGPNNLLIAVNTNGSVEGVKLLSSGDTPEHVELVRENPSFLQRFRGWTPTAEVPPKVDGVAGATLTTYAMAEAIVKRLAGATPSLRFPDPITLDEVRALFTNATAFRHDGRRLRVSDSTGKLLGFIARTSPEADNVAGYRGPTETLVSIAPDGRKIMGVRVRRTYDTPSYAEQISEEETYLKLFEGRTVDELAALDFRREKIEGVSGATETSYAIAEGLKRRFASDVRARSTINRWKPKARDWALAAVVAGACLIGFTPLRGKRAVRVAWQCVLIGYVGLVSGDLLSLSLLGGWSAHGLALRATPGLVLMAAAALVVPLLTRRQLYCHHICPHGAVQQWLGALNPRKHRPRAAHISFSGASHAPVKRESIVSSLPFLLLAFAILAVLLRWPIDLAQLEPFDAWVWRTATMATLTIMVVGFAASVFVPQAYCRFGCPTGALLNFVRTSGSGDRWGAKDWAAGALLACAILAILATRIPTSGSPLSSTFRPLRSPLSPLPSHLFKGFTMGTTWSVKIRGTVSNRPSVQAAIQAEFDRIEDMTSHWRSNTPVGKLNSHISTEPLRIPSELATLLQWSADVSAASGGAFDVTVAPLARAWGFGPEAQRGVSPSDAQLAEARQRVGWTNIVISAESVRKHNAAAELDLSAIVPGYAVDRVIVLLAARGYTNVLVESGGELRAGGVWEIAIEHPARSCTLSNQAIGTSGTYRQNWKANDKSVSHLIDPRTGRPVTHSTVSVSVRMADCARADAWAAALNILGVESGFPLAETKGLAAQFVVESDGKLLVRETSHWNSTAPALQPTRN